MSEPTTSAKGKQPGQDETRAKTPREEDLPFGKIRLRADVDVLDSGKDVVVSLRNVHKTYLLGIEGVPALRGVSLTIKRGEFVCIFGTSGGGKTTLLNLIGTIDRPSKGEIYLCGSHITPRTPDKLLSELRLKRMGFVFQTFNLLSALSAVENVELPMILLGETTAAERRERALALLASVGMAKRINHLPSQLSGGEQQRVTIARAMANHPEILLLDEPTGDLDTHNTAIAMSLLLELNKKQGITLIMVTHDVGLKAFADRVVWMRDGLVQRIETVGPMQKQEAMTKLNEELAREPASTDSTATVQAATEIRTPHDYEPLAFQMRQLHSRRSLVALGLTTPQPGEEQWVTPVATAAIPSEPAVAVVPQVATEEQKPKKQHKRRHHHHRHTSSGGNGGNDSGSRVWPDDPAAPATLREATEIAVP